MNTFLARFSRGHFGLTRLEAFSDAVFAIIVTLLVLELKVPHLHDVNSVGELWQALVELLPKFVSWLISFIIVCKFWLNHHHLMSLARHANYGLLWVNSIFLLGQSFIPFPTAMAGEYPGNPLAVSLYGVVFAFNTLLFLALQVYVQRNLLKPELADAQDPYAAPKGLIGAASYLLGTLAAWFDIRLAFLIYALTPLFFITPWQYRGSSGEQAKSQ